MSKTIEESMEEVYKLAENRGEKMRAMEIDRLLEEGKKVQLTEEELRSTVLASYTLQIISNTEQKLKLFNFQAVQSAIQSDKVLSSILKSDFKVVNKYAIFANMRVRNKIMSILLRDKEVLDYVMLTNSVALEAFLHDRFRIADPSEKEEFVKKLAKLDYRALKLVNNFKEIKGNKELKDQMAKLVYTTSIKNPKVRFKLSRVPVKYFGDKVFRYELEEAIKVRILAKYANNQEKADKKLAQVRTEINAMYSKFLAQEKKDSAEDSISA